MNSTRHTVAKRFVLTSVYAVNDGPSGGFLVEVVVQIPYLHQIRQDEDLKEGPIEDKI